jgi:glycosyltransferase involved in cell wall biosynthesis
LNLVIFASQVSPYHNARFVGATKHFDKVHVVSTMNAGDFPEFLAKSLGEYSLHRLFDGHEAYAAAAVSGALSQSVRDILDRLQPDAIAAAGWTAPESLAALEYGREKFVPTVVMSESQADDAPRSFIREAVKKRVVSQFDAALVGGPPHAAYAARLGIPHDCIQLGYNAVDNAYFEFKAHLARADTDKLRSRLGLPNCYILASARFINKKNLPNLVLAYADARSKLPDLPDLVILGDGPERTAVENAIQLCGVEPVVHLPGFRGYEHIPAFYGLSEAFVHVSASEQWGLVINEAMASGVPVIASRPCGAARTVIQDGVSGLLTGTDVSSISDALVRLFGMTQEQRSSIGHSGATAIKDWGPERFGSGMRAAVDSAQKAPRRGSIPIWDRPILNRLQRKVIDTVS